jgi:3-hydroxyisobutyrate dehydrogenase-like beta-hydroxyacid dehydrogenase
MRIAFLGLGQMGTPMTRRLLGAGHDVTVWNRTRTRADPLAADGVRVAASPAEAVADAEVVVTMLSTPEAVDEVLFGRDGAAAAMHSGSMLIEMSTIGPEAERRIRERMRDGVDAIDAPVLGSVPQATEGTLRIFVGATDENLARARSVLDPFGTVIHLGGPGAGAAMKLVANSTIGAAISAVGEALALTDALGLPREQVLEILSNSPVGPTVTGKRANIESHSYPPNFKLGLAAKDMRLVTEQAERDGVELKIGRAAAEWLALAEAEGHADEDYSSAVESIAKGREDRD